MQDAWDGAVSFCISFRAGWDVAGWGPTYYPKLRTHSRKTLLADACQTLFASPPQASSVAYRSQSKFSQCIGLCHCHTFPYGPNNSNNTSYTDQSNTI
uniref:Uncharacterized protein n=1 Tax=Hyaloperonospora arabidopsidis (strain Emoy2) TaxID=559515 RepID=M4BW07_HYAAE